MSIFDNIYVGLFLVGLIPILVYFDIKRSRKKSENEAVIWSEYIQVFIGYAILFILGIIVIYRAI